jgi:hypothetical protein
MYCSETVHFDRDIQEVGGLFSKFLWKLRLCRAVSGGGPKSLRARLQDVFVKLPSRL